MEKKWKLSVNINIYIYILNSFIKLIEENKEKKGQKEENFIFSFLLLLLFPSPPRVEDIQIPFIFFLFPSSICRELLRESLEEEEKFY